MENKSVQVNYYIDDITVSMRNMRISGWMYSDASTNNIVVKPKRKKGVTVVQYAREDINEMIDYPKEYKSGFDIYASPFIPLEVTFIDGEHENKMKFTGLKQYHKAIKNVLFKVKRSLKRNGLKNTIIICMWHLFPSKKPNIENYHQWFMARRLSAKELDEQKNYKFIYNPLISIVIPTYNTPVKLLIDLVNSIKSQTYTNWELCLADGNSSNNDTISILEKLSNTDSRIKVKFLEENYMISGNTNEAIKMATGEFIALMDHDDLIEPDTLFEVVKLLNEDQQLDFIYTDEDKVTEDGKTFLSPHFKPDFSIDNLRSYNYITHFSIIRKKILDEIGLFDSKCDGAQDYDMFLRIADYTNKIGHIARPLYHWRITGNSTAQSESNKTYVLDAGKNALRKHLERNGIEGTVTDGLAQTLYRINYEIVNNPKVSIIICTKDHIDDLDLCIQSVLTKTTYKNYEIIVVENNSTEQETFEYYKTLEKYDNVKVVYWEDEFNYSAINNFGVKYATGEYVLLLNNDIEVISPEWLTEMLMLAQRKDVGAVGAKLLYPDDTIQHAGVIVGLGGVAGHSHKNYKAKDAGYMRRLQIVQDLSAVTAACLLLKKSIFEEVGGLDEKFKVAFNDIDFCLKIRKAGYLNVFTPYAELYHHESKSRGLEDTAEKQKRFKGEIDRFKEKWPEILENGDPFYNPNLTLDREDFTLE